MPEYASNEEKISLLGEQHETDLAEFLEFAFGFLDNKGRRFFELSGEDMKRCKQLVFTGKIYVDADKNIYTHNISSIFRGQELEKDTEVSLKSNLVRLLQSHCNRERQTANLERLRAQAATERVLRPKLAATAPRGPKRLSEATNIGIVTDYQGGMKAGEIATKYKINEWTVRHRLHRAGVPLRSNSMSDEQVELTRQLRTTGLSFARIAERVGFSEGTVRNVLKRPKPQASSDVESALRWSAEPPSSGRV